MERIIEHIKIYLNSLIGIFHAFTVKKSVGLDISDHTIEAVELSRSRGRIRAVKMSREILEENIVAAGRIKDRQKLRNAIINIFDKAKPEPLSRTAVIVGLPENLVYLHFFNSPLPPSPLLEEAVANEIRNNIPVEIDNVLHDYKKVAEYKEETGTRKNYRYLLICVEKEVVNEWKDFFSELDIDARLFDLKPLALHRAITERRRKNVCIADIGSENTNISIFETNSIFFSHTINCGSGQISKKASSELSLPLNVVENIIKESGLNSVFTKEKTFAIYENCLMSVPLEIVRAISYYRQKTGNNIDEIILAGGSSSSEAMVDFIKTRILSALAFKNNAGQTMPWGAAASPNGRQEKEIPVKKARSTIGSADDGAEYLEAIGLALRVFSSAYTLNEPAIKANPSKLPALVANLNCLKNLSIRLTSRNIAIFALIIVIMLSMLIFFKQKVFRGDKAAIHEDHPTATTSFSAEEGAADEDVRK